MSDINEIIDNLLKIRDDSIISIGGGCSDGNCCIRRPIGQHTNGGCRCAHYIENRYKLERALRINQIFTENVARAIKDF